MTKFKVRPILFREKRHRLPQATAIMIPPGCDVRELGEMEWRDIIPGCSSLRHKAMRCVEYDRHCAAISKQRRGDSHG